MTKVALTFMADDTTVIKTEEIETTGDTVYIFDDIMNHLNTEDGYGEFEKVPEGTKRIVIAIDCDF